MSFRLRQTNITEFFSRSSRPELLNPLSEEFIPSKETKDRNSLKPSTHMPFNLASPEFNKATNIEEGKTLVAQP